MRKNPSSCDSTEIRTYVPMSEGFEVTNWELDSFRVDAVPKIIYHEFVPISRLASVLYKKLLPKLHRFVS